MWLHTEIGILDKCYILLKHNFELKNLWMKQWNHFCKYNFSKLGTIKDTAILLDNPLEVYNKSSNKRAGVLTSL